MNRLEYNWNKNWKILELDLNLDGTYWNITGIDWNITGTKKGFPPITDGKPQKHKPFNLTKSTIFDYETYFLLKLK